MEPRRIFVRAPNWVGDVVMATASFERLRRAFPEARLTCGLRPYLRSLLDGTTWFDDMLDAPRAGGIRGAWRQAALLRAMRFDLAVILPNSLETALVAWLAGIPGRVGYRQGRSLLLTGGPRARPAPGRPWRRGPHRVPEPMPRYYARLLDSIGLPPGELHPRLAVTVRERETLAGWLRDRGVAEEEPLLAVNMGGSYGASKLWAPDRFAAVIRHFQRRGMRALLVSGPGEVDMVRDVARQSGALAMTDPVQPVGMLKPVMERAALCVTTDSGPRHVAVAFDVPVVCLIGPTDRRYTDYSLERTRLLRKDLACSPCQRKVCPLGHHDCMRLITADEVVAAAEELLQRFPASADPKPGR